MSALRVVYLNHCAQLSGAELALLRVLPVLRDVEAQVILAEDGPLVAELRGAGVSVEVLPMNEQARDLPREQVGRGVAGLVAAARSGTYAWRLAARLRDIRPDLVHTNSLKAALYGGVAARLAGLPVVWHVRDRVAEDYLPPAVVRQVRLLARVLPSVIIANSHATLSTLPAARTGTGTVVYDPTWAGEHATSRPPLPLRVGIVGRIARWKGHDIFLRAFAAAFPDGPEQAVIVGAPLFGEHEYEDELRRLADSLGLVERIEFRGFRRDVASEMGRLHILVHASRIPEPFGLVVVEGMASGLAVLAADRGGPSEVVRHGIDGLLYRMGDEDALAEGLRRVGADAAERDRLGRAAIERSRHFSPEAIAADIAAVYDRLLLGQGRLALSGSRR